MFNDALLREFSAKAVLSYARARIPQTYLGPLLFPAKTINELTFEYWQDQNLLPVMATLNADNTEATIASRDGATKVTGEIPAIKRKIMLDEKGLIALKRAGAGDNDQVRTQLYNDIDNMLAAVHARIEKLRIDALANGTMTLNENGIAATVDFGVPSTLKETLDNANTAHGYWTNALAEPITQMQTWSQAVIDSCGIAPTRAICSSTVLALILKNASVRTSIWGDNGGTRPVALAELNNLLASMNLPRIQTYDTKVRTQAAAGTYTTAALFPLTKFVMFGDGKLGDTLYGPTAEALMHHDLTASEAPGLFASVDEEKEPPAIWTKAAARAFPTFPGCNSIFQAVVTA